MSNVKEVVRVGINNNFNCTSDEFTQVEGFKLVRSNAMFFVNSNIKTPKLLEINNHNVNVVVTVNPDITVDRKMVNKLYKLDQAKVSFVRVRYIPENESINKLITELSEKGYKVVITVMRFKSNDSLSKFTKKSHYDFTFSWLRLKKEGMENLEKFIGSLKNVYICDAKV